MDTSIVIVDDHDGFRSWARRLLEAGGFAVVGEAADGAGGILTVDQLRPDAVLLDVQLPDLDGFEVAARLALAAPACLVILTSTHDAATYRRELATSSAVAFVPKAELDADALHRLLAVA